MITIICLALLGQPPAGPGDLPVARVTIRGGGKPRGETPIRTPVGRRLEPGAYELRVGSARIPASIDRHGEISLLSATLESLPPAGEVSYRLFRRREPVRPGEGIELIDVPEGVEVRLDGKPFTTYLARSGSKPCYFPVVGPTGRGFTRSFPMRDVPGEARDHPHQRSLWFSHGKVNGVDFWSEVKGHGSIVETSRAIVRGAPAFGQINTRDDWVGPDGKVVCSDIRSVRFYATRFDRIIDFGITIEASHGPATFGDTKEGMFGVRVASTMDVTAKKGGKITNSDGLIDGAAWGKPANWVDYSGPVDGQTVGIAILDAPSNFRHPTTWHVRTYGLFAANPFGWHDFGMAKAGDHVIPAGESIHFGYRVILHGGDAESALLPTAYESYVYPPEIEIKVE